MWLIDFKIKTAKKKKKHTSHQNPTFLSLKKKYLQNRIISNCQMNFKRTHTHTHKNLRATPALTALTYYLKRPNQLKGGEGNS